MASSFPFPAVPVFGERECQGEPGVKGDRSVESHALLSLESLDRFILEGKAEGNDTILFGIVIGLMEDEYGYISLNELSEVELDLTKQGYGKLQVRQQQEFQPTPLKKLQDNRLQRFLARFKN